MDALGAARREAAEKYNNACKRLNTAITEAEGRATARTIIVKDIIDEIAFVEKTLGLPKKLLEGVCVYIDSNAQDFPKAYTWMPESTKFHAEFRSGSWRITKIYRGPCSRYGCGHQLNLTDAARDALIGKMRMF